MPNSTALSVSLQQLLNLEAQARHLKLPNLFAQHRLVAPGRTSAAIGQGLDLKELRTYQQGDDLRHLDWNTTARHGQLYTRVFETEKNNRWVIWLDLSSQLHFAQIKSKLVLATHLTSLLGWSALHSGDSVGAWVFNDTNTWQHNFITNKAVFSKLLQQLATTSAQTLTFQPRPEDQLDLQLQQFNAWLPQNCQVILISDFNKFDSYAQITNLAQRHKVIALHLDDPLDSHLPLNQGPIYWAGQQQTITPALQQAWQHNHTHRTEQLKQALAGYGSYILASTLSPNLLNLLGYLDTTGINSRKR